MNSSFLTLSVLCLSMIGCSTPPPPAQTAPTVAKADDSTPEVLVSGTVELGMGAVSDRATAVFVSLRGGPGPPVAAKKLANGPFPMKFELTTADRPMQTGRPIPSKLTLKLALDGDGNPMSDEGLGAVVVEIDKGATGGTFKMAAPIPPSSK
jgi:hypothetical protein